MPALEIMKLTVVEFVQSKNDIDLVIPCLYSSNACGVQVCKRDSVIILDTVHTTVKLLHHSCHNWHGPESINVLVAFVS